jgi:Lrp/AsnC family leucine-responsive transcriptional regulator
MYKLDRKDREILFQLDLDARQPNSRIAKKVRASKEVVGYRIRRMVDAGVIQGFYALVDITKLGFHNGRMFFKLKKIGPEEEKRFIGYFNSHPNSWWVNSNSGSYFSDAGIAFWVRDVDDFHEMKEEILGKFRQNLESYADSFYSKIHVWRRNYLSPRQEARKYDLIPGSSRAVSFDERDLRLLEALSCDARIPLVELARKAGLSASAAKYRLKSLRQKKVILGFRPKIDLAKIGHYWYKVEFQLEDYRTKHALQAFCGAHPNVVYAYESIGGRTDFEIELEVESHEKFREVLDSMRARFKDSIRTYSFNLWSAEHRLVFFPTLGFFRRQGVI